VFESVKSHQNYSIIEKMGFLFLEYHDAVTLRFIVDQSGSLDCLVEWRSKYPETCRWTWWCWM